MATQGSIAANTPIAVAGKAGIATLILGTVDVVDAGVTASSAIIFATCDGGILAGFVRVSAISVGVGFTLLSTNLTDTATLSWVRIEP